MKRLLVWGAMFGALAASAQTSPRNLHSLSADSIDGKPVQLSRFRGKTLLIVNTASQCGHTPQYEGLETLYQRYRERGFEVLAFPSNDFGGQEPGSNAAIKKFCALNYKTTFPLFAKVKMSHPVFRYLTQAKGFEGEVTWNFTKFLVSPHGEVVARFEPPVEPLDEELVHKLEAALPKR
ncbi:MAG: glutathione peroxidase [Myxococcota bacterium]